MDHELRSKLATTIAQGESIFLSKVDRLEQLRQRVPVAPDRQVTQETVTAWLRGIKHLTGCRHRKINRHATAYYFKQSIRYNSIYLGSVFYAGEWDERILDLVLHEMGHLFAYYFLRTHGHEWTWRTIGEIVGYAPVGSTSEERRKLYRSYAAHTGTVAEQAPISQVVANPVNQVMSRSTITSPVATVWAICEKMQGRSRRDILAYCINNGINPNTAATQYAKWKKSRQ